MRCPKNDQNGMWYWLARPVALAVLVGDFETSYLQITDTTWENSQAILKVYTHENWLKSRQNTPESISEETRCGGDA